MVADIVIIICGLLQGIVVEIGNEATNYWNDKRRVDWLVVFCEEFFVEIVVEKIFFRCRFEHVFEYLSYIVIIIIGIYVVVEISFFILGLFA